LFEVYYQVICCIVGAGKTTLLNVLAGRLRSGYSQTGQVLIDGESLNKHLKRKVSYVLQEDVFFSFLTLKQTLTYSALLRLPSSMTKQAKLRMVDHAIQVLGVENCQNTIFGSAFYSGLSGGKLVGLALIIFVILIKGGICSTFYF
jgi:ABC-type multidrug transport system ATPase subunit